MDSPLCESTSRRFQPVEGPSWGLLRDYKPSDGPFSGAVLPRCRGSRGNRQRSWNTIYYLRRIRDNLFILCICSTFAQHSALRHVTSATRMLQFIGFAQEIRAYFYKLLRIISHQ